MAELNKEKVVLADVVRVKDSKSNFTGKRLRKQQLGISVGGDGSQNKAKTQLVARVDYDNDFNVNSDDGGGQYVYFDSSERVDEKIHAAEERVERGQPESDYNYQVGNANGGWTDLIVGSHLEISAAQNSGGRSQAELKWKMPVRTSVSAIEPALQELGSLVFITGVSGQDINKVYYWDGFRWDPLTNQ